MFCRIHFLLYLCNTKQQDKTLEIMKQQYFTAKQGDNYSIAFEVVGELKNRGIWVREMSYKRDPVTGKGYDYRSREGGRVLLTATEEGYYISKTNPLYRGFKFYPTEVPTAHETAEHKSTRLFCRF